MPTSPGASYALLRTLVVGAVLECSLAGTWANAAVDLNRAAEIVVPPLWDAAHRGDLREVRALLRKGTPVDVLFDGETPLMGSLEPIIGLPPSRMGPPSAKEHRARVKRDADKLAIAGLLLAAGADVRLTGHFEVTALHLAALAFGPEEQVLPIVRDLIRRGAPVDARTSEGRTALQLAVWRKRPEIATVLVVAGASLDARDSNGKSAADELIAQGNQRELDELRTVASKRL